MIGEEEGEYCGAGESWRKTAWSKEIENAGRGEGPWRRL